MDQFLNGNTRTFSSEDTTRLDQSNEYKQGSFHLPRLYSRRLSLCESRVREIRMHGCASSKGWRVQWEVVFSPTKAKVRAL